VLKQLGFFRVAGLLPPLLRIHCPWVYVQVQILECDPEPLLDDVGVFNAGVGEYAAYGFEVLLLCYFECHVVVVIVDVVVDLVVDYDLVLFVPDMQEDAGLVPALGLAHEIFAVLDGAEEHAESAAEVVEGLNKAKRTIRATAAYYFCAKVT